MMSRLFCLTARAVQINNEGSFREDVKDSAIKVHFNVVVCVGLLHVGHVALVGGMDERQELLHAV